MMEPSTAQGFGAISKQNQWSAGAEKAISRIGPTVRIKGEVTADEDLLILGSVEGVIEHDHTLTVHAQGTVKAEIKAREVFIEGNVEGNVYGTSRVRIEECGALTGNVFRQKYQASAQATHNAERAQQQRAKDLASPPEYR